MSASDLRISFVTGTLQLGGSTTFLCNLAGELIRRHVTCRVFSDDSLHPLAKDFERLGIPVSLQNSRRNIFEDRIAGVLAELREYEPTAVVATIAPFAFEVLRYVPRGLLRVAMVQSDDPLVYRTVEKYANYVDIVVGVSAAIARQLEELDSFQNVSKRHLPYGVTIPDQPIETSRTGQPLRILYLGRVINEQKRVYLFPKIAASLEKAGVTFLWTIAGEGPDRAALERRMKFQSISQIKFTGPLNYKDVAHVLDKHDIIILTSDYEGLPLSLLEAMGHGLVPVVTDLESGTREVVDETNGVLVKMDDEDGYARAIAHLFMDREELAAKSAAAHERVKVTFSIAAMTDRWLSILIADGKPVLWPRHFNVRGPLTDPRQWRYLPVSRFLRRTLKRLTSSSLKAFSSNSNSADGKMGKTK